MVPQAQIEARDARFKEMAKIHHLQTVIEQLESGQHSPQQVMPSMTFTEVPTDATEAPSSDGRTLSELERSVVEQGKNIRRVLGLFRNPQKNAVTSPVPKSVSKEDLPSILLSGDASAVEAGSHQLSRLLLEISALEQEVSLFP